MHGARMPPQLHRVNAARAGVVKWTTGWLSGGLEARTFTTTCEAHGGPGAGEVPRPGACGAWMSTDMPSPSRKCSPKAYFVTARGAKKLCCNHQTEGLMSSAAQKPTVEAQPLIAVRNVRASSRWYGQLLAADSLPEHSHRDLYDRIYCSGRLLLQLHAWEEEDHPNLVNADAVRPGHGVLLWFQVDDFDSVVQRARELGAEIIQEPHINPAPRHREIRLRDSDGYVVVVASPDGECGS
jgi:hypothetical protein